MLANLLLLLLAALAGTALAAQPGSEIAVVLDNSCSMAEGSDINGTRVPANDTQRLAVLGAQVVYALGQGGQDRVTVIGFGKDHLAPPVSTATLPDLRAWPYSGGTYFRRPLTEAARLLSASDRETKLLVFFTDGVPSPEDNIRSTADLQAIFDPAKRPDIDVLAIGLFNHPLFQEQGSILLSALTHDPARDLVSVKSASEVVSAFTVAFARAIGSRPETGTLLPGQTHRVKVSRYVSEVIAVAVSKEPGKAFQSYLAGPAGQVKPLASGDNGCTPAVAAVVPQSVCAAPRRHYQVFRGANDPDKPSEWTLTLEAGPGPVDFGIILRYDLKAALEVAPSVAAGTAVPLRARLMFRGQTFDDAEFFSAEGFTAVAHVDGQEVMLKHEGGGIFTGTWTAPDPGLQNKPVVANVTFKNNWMEQSAAAGFTVTPPPYTLVVGAPLTLDPIPSRWSKSQLCGEISLAGSHNIENVEITCEVRDKPLQPGFTCSRTAPQTITVCGVTSKWCCGKTGEVSVYVAGPGGQPPRTAATVPVQFRVADPGFLRCHWLAITLTLAALLFGWLIVGFVRPYSFDPAAAVTLAGSERGLARATPQILRERPGGKRGFYRNARVCINGAGDIVRSPKEAVIVLEAGPNRSTIFKRGAGLEHLDRRARKWAGLTPEELAGGYQPGVLYRLGDLYLKFE